MGAALPSVASVLGSGASRLGATALGSSLSNYGTTNAILPALGMVLWLIYSLWIKAVPLIIGNVISLILAIIILTMKYIWR